MMLTNDFNSTARASFWLDAIDLHFLPGPDILLIAVQEINVIVVLHSTLTGIVRIDPLPRAATKEDKRWVFLVISLPHNHCRTTNTIWNVTDRIEPLP